MARIKKDKTSWRSSGIIKRDFKHDTSQPDDVVRGTAKKNRAKWCGGHIGREHVLRRTFYKTYGGGKYFDWEYWNNRLFKYIGTNCVKCGRNFYNHDKSIPLVIPVREYSEQYPVQLKVNGVTLPIHASRYLEQHYCWDCWTYHTYAEEHGYNSKKSI